MNYVNYVVIHKTPLNKNAKKFHSAPLNENAEVFGPFGNIIDAKSWMAQELSDLTDVAKMKGEKINDWWDDGTVEKLPSCGVKDTNETWEIAVFFGR